MKPKRFTPLSDVIVIHTATELCTEVYDDGRMYAI